MSIDDYRPALDIEPTFGALVQLEGRYEVDPIPGGKRFQGAWLVMDDGTRYVIAYRPVPEYFKFMEKRVLVRGRPFTPGPDTQHIQAQHLEVNSIELASGETPYASPPTELVAPPIVKTTSELVKRDVRWVQVVGVLESVQGDSDGYLGIARLRLADTAEVQARNVSIGDSARHEGKVVTVTSRVARTEKSGEVTYELIGWYAICEGEVARCEMDSSLLASYTPAK